MTKFKKISLYAVAVVLGGLLAFSCTNGFQRKNNKKKVSDYIYTGNSKEKLKFKEYHKGLFLSDSTVLQYREGILATPKVAGEVAFIILTDFYSYDIAKINLPYNIYKNIYTWDIKGTCLYSAEKGHLYFDAGRSIMINRSNGMIVIYL